MGLLAVALITAVLGACATGERPTVTSEPRRTDEASEAVRALLSQPPDQFTATYQITPTTAGVDVRTATVVSSDGRTRVTVGDVDYLIVDDQATTCIERLGECFDELREGYISDLNITHEFWGPAFERRLTVDSDRRIGPSEQYDREIADQSSRCVDIQVAGGTVGYCATEPGLLARYTGADTTIELLSLSTEADAEYLAPDLDAAATG